MFADERILKDAHNAKYDTKVLGRAGMPVSAWDTTRCSRPILLATLASA